MRFVALPVAVQKVELPKKNEMYEHREIMREVHNLHFAKNFAAPSVNCICHDGEMFTYDIESDAILVYPMEPISWNGFNPKNAKTMTPPILNTLENMQMVEYLVFWITDLAGDAQRVCREAIKTGVLGSRVVHRGSDPPHNLHNLARYFMSVACGQFAPYLDNRRFIGKWNNCAITTFCEIISKPKIIGSPSKGIWKQLQEYLPTDKEHIKVCFARCA